MYECDMAVNPDKSVRKLITFQRELLEQVEAYRRTQKPIPAEAEAIRRLIRKGLAAERKKLRKA